MTRLMNKQINKRRRVLNSMKYECVVCGYIYDEEKEGVKFSELPDDWVCPDCGVSKDDFDYCED